MKYLFVVFVLCLYFVSISIAQFQCDSGDLSTTCFVHSTKTFNESIVISGNSITIVYPGELSCSISQCSIQIIMTNSTTVYGTIIAGYIEINSTNVVITGVINATALGYTTGSGPGAGFSSSNVSLPSGGGSFAGYSFMQSGSNENSSLGPYGNFTTAQFGSGGGLAGSQQGGNGGGMIIINSATTFLTGRISANGEYGAGYSGGGSGGSVFINGALTSDNSNLGSITANGGGSDYGGLGSGGRIYIEMQTTNIYPQAVGAIGFTNQNSVGAAGTIYTRQNDKLLINNTYIGFGTSFMGYTPLPTIFVTSIVVVDAFVQMGEILNTTSFYLDSKSKLQNSNQFTTTIIYSENFTAITYAEISMKNASFYVRRLFFEGTIFGSALYFNADTMQMGQLAIIQVDGGGYASAMGPGAGQSGVGQPGGGAGYGANGTPSCGSKSAGGFAYGDTSSPTLFGSGGGDSGSVLGGSGGGVISIIANSLGLFGGRLSADGLPGSNAPSSSSIHGAGGGSGGSIQIITQHITGYLAGYVTISAKGGSGGLSNFSGGLGGGAGSGGRIFVSSNITDPISNFYSAYLIVYGGSTSCSFARPNGNTLNKCVAAGYAPESSPEISCTPCSAGYYTTDGLTCNACPAGTSTNYETGSTECKACSPGYYSYRNGSLSCIACSSGSYSSIYGATYCIGCSAGYYSSIAQSVCTPCPTGSYSSYSYSSYCTSCSPSYYQNSTGQTSCNLCSYGSTSTYAATSCTVCGPGTYVEGNYCNSCPYGTYSSEFANEICTSCPAGSYQSFSGMSYCNQCPAGSYSYNFGSLSCSFCEYGTYNNYEGATSCSYCPSNTYTPDIGSTKCQHCSGTVVLDNYCDESNFGLFWLYWIIPVAVAAIAIPICIGLVIRRYRRRMLATTYQPVATYGATYPQAYNVQQQQYQFNGQQPVQYQAQFQNNGQQQNPYPYPYPQQQQQQQQQQQNNQVNIQQNPQSPTITQQ